MSLYLVPAALVLAVVIGFLAGPLIYHRSRRWCQACGSTLKCPNCQHHMAGRS